MGQKHVSQHLLVESDELRVLLLTGQRQGPQPVWKPCGHHQGLAGRSGTYRGHRAEPGHGATPGRPGKPVLGVECADPLG